MKKNPVKWEHLTYPEIGALAEQDAIVILPLGSTEQHGPHLPVGTDTYLATAVAERVAQSLCELGKPAVVAPSFTVANSTHHMSFPGSMTLQPETFQEVLLEYCECFKAHGFSKIAFINGHGGNRAPAEVALIPIVDQLGLKAYAMMHILGSEKEVAGILDTQLTLIHACEGETSMMLYLHPELVDPIYKETAECDVTKESLPKIFSSKPASFERFETLTKSGCYGNANASTAEKGEKIVAVMTKNLTNILADDDLWK